MEHGCANNQIVDPQSTLRNLANEELFDGDDEAQNVQLKPQQVEIRIRPSKIFFN